MGKSWKRIHGTADLQPVHKEKHEAAKNRYASQEFKEACISAGVEATMRQARKWNNKKGAAYKKAHKIQ